jgi:hypothetical protein
MSGTATVYCKSAPDAKFQINKNKEIIKYKNKSLVPRLVPLHHVVERRLMHNSNVFE